MGCRNVCRNCKEISLFVEIVYFLMAKPEKAPNYLLACVIKLWIYFLPCFDLKREQGKKQGTALRVLISAT